MTEKAIRYIDEHFDHFLDVLKDLARIPSVSADTSHPAEMRKSADAVVKSMRDAGLEHCGLLEVEGAHPAAYGDWLHAPGKPTLLLYAHHDVQPPGRPDHWKTPPFEPTVREDGRLYARGVADDKAGIVVHLAAIQAWLKSEGKLPVNVKMLIEGEEEIGSDHLTEILARFRDQLLADAIVVTDTGNLEAGLPSITYRLRGIASVFVEVSALDHPLHSGTWGGPVPDPVQAMAKILATLSDEHGGPSIPGLFDEVRAPSKLERDAIARLPFDEAAFRRDGGVLDGVALVGEPGFSPNELNWLRPCVTVIALEASPIKGSSNQIVPSARARISVRLVPDMDPERTARIVAEHVRRVAPWGVQVRTEAEHGVQAWMCEPEGPAFAAATRALERGYGKPAAMIGAGGAIGFVRPFSEALGGAPALLVGVEDPICNAHSENESLNLVDTRAAMKSAVYLYEEISTIK